MVPNTVEEINCVRPRSKENRPFRFEAAWLLHPEFKHLFASAWNKGEGNLLMAVENVNSEIRVWKEEVFGEYFQAKAYPSSRD
ncbi:hypothetical protein COLO4_07574 [Corchorus olitorius]|uniref:Uncharacterized protein n=1 Tax=Corchorus olitorius TaxID=93759 RepID=A0A1R3KJ93_9ROSI|nr:hypothetical protein COLO4_07574 [Corchorus olitorius]